MSDLVRRLRDANTTRRIGESYADTHERRQQDREEAADRIEQLEDALDILQAAMTAKKPIPMAFKKAILEARAALEEERT